MNEETEIEEFAPWLVLIITLIGAGLRVLLLDYKGMWLDETFSVWLANHSLPDMLQWIARIDQHPPLYYLLLHYWIALKGDTPYYVRQLSAIIGAGTIPVIYLIGKRISGAVVGLVATALLALSPFHVYYAQETRMYTLLTFNAAVGMYALVRLLTDARSTRPIGSQFREYLRAWHATEPVESYYEGDFSYREMLREQGGWQAWIFRHRWLPIQAIETDLAWVAFIVFSAATLLSHNTAVLFPLATNIFVLGLMLFQSIKKSGSPPALQAPSFGNWVKAQIGIFLIWSPWIGPFIQQVRGVDQQFWLPKPNWEVVTQTLRALLNPSAPGQISQVMTWTLCAVLCLGLVYYRKKLSIFLFLAALYAVPILPDTLFGELIVSIRRPIFIDRTLIWITIPMFLALAAGIAQLRFRLLIIVGLGILSINYLSSSSDYLRFVQKEDWKYAAGYVAYFAEKNDLILFNDAFVQFPFDYYFKAYEKKYFLQVEKHGVPVDIFESGILEPRMTDSDIPRLISMLCGHNRVWLVYSHNDITDPKGLVPQTLALQMKLIRQRDFYGGQVQLYGAP